MIKPSRHVQYRSTSQFNTAVRLSSIPQYVSASVYKGPGMDSSSPSKQEVVLEVCIDSVAGARAAEAAGADRVELCSDLVEGGITPSWGLVKHVRGVLQNTKLMVLIRPRGGDFVYTHDEVQVMLSDIEACSDLGAHGVVFGCLMPDGDVDVDATRQLVHQAQKHGLDMTFHRAFDVCRDRSVALEALVSLGIQRVLTSGGCPTAQEGIPALALLVQQAAGRISVMAGGGVRSSNAQVLLQSIAVRELHSSTKKRTVSQTTYRPANMHLSARAPPSDYEWDVTDELEARQLVSIIKEQRSLP